MTENAAIFVVSSPPPSHVTHRDNEGLAPAAVRTLEMAYYECRMDPYRGLRVTEEEGGGDTVAASETSPEQQAALLDTEEELVEMGYGRDRAATERRAVELYPDAIVATTDAPFRTDVVSSARGGRLDGEEAAARGDRRQRRPSRAPRRPHRSQPTKYRSSHLTYLLFTILQQEQSPPPPLIF